MSFVRQNDEKRYDGFKKKKGKSRDPQPAFFPLAFAFHSFGRALDENLIRCVAIEMAYLPFWSV